MKYSFFRFEGPSPALRAYMEVEDYHQLVLAMATQVSAMDLPTARRIFFIAVHLLDFKIWRVLY